MRCDELDEDLLDTIGLFGEEKVTSQILILQTKQLINMFLGKLSGFCQGETDEKPTYLTSNYTHCIKI